MVLVVDGCVAADKEAVLLITGFTLLSAIGVELCDSLAVLFPRRLKIDEL